MNELTKLSACEIVAKIKSRQITAEEVTRFFVNRIKSIDPKINAFVTLSEEESIGQAKEIDRKISKNEDPGILCGVPIAVKDNMMVSGLPTTCSSKMLKNYISPYDATVTELLKKSGAVILGKTNLDEFAMGSSTENSAFFTTKNPWNTEYIPGGSSGGSAACVASRMVPVSLGSDTGGSIRQPASCCGVVGIKPTYGRVSRYGLVAFASSLDQIGTFSRNVEDTAALLGTIAGYDSKDSTSMNIPVPDYSSLMKKDLKGMRIGLPKEYFISGLNKDVESLIKTAVKDIEDLGAEIVEISLPHTEYAVAVYYIIAPSEASSNLARYDGVKYGFRAECDNLKEEYEKTRGLGFGSEVKRRIMLGTYALSAGYYDAYYGKAQRVRTLILNDFKKAYEKVDVILTPTAPTAAFRKGDKSSDPLQMYLSDVFTISCNLAGVPGISVPCGFTSEGLPVGLQLMGGFFREEDILRVAYQYEQKTKYFEREPDV